MTDSLDQSQVGPTAVERADALLNTWGQRLNPTGKATAQGRSESMRPQTDGGTVHRADTLLDRVGHRLSGRGLVEVAAYGYVALAVRVGRTANEVQKTWQESAQAARRQQEEQAAKTGGTQAAHKVASDEKNGEQILSRTATDAAKDAEEGVDVAADAAA